MHPENTDIWVAESRHCMELRRGRSCWLSSVFVTVAGLLRQEDWPWKNKARNWAYRHGHPHSGPARRKDANQTTSTTPQASLFGTLLSETSLGCCKPGFGACTSPWHRMMRIPLSFQGSREPGFSFFPSSFAYSYMYIYIWLFTIWLKGVREKNCDHLLVIVWYMLKGPDKGSFFLYALLLCNCVVCIFSLSFFSLHHVWIQFLLVVWYVQCIWFGLVWINTYRRKGKFEVVYIVVSKWSFCECDVFSFVVVVVLSHDQWYKGCLQ